MNSKLVVKSWLSDFARITFDGQSIFLCVIVDSSTRAPLALSSTTEPNAALVINGLKQAAERERMPIEICFDQDIRRLPDYEKLKVYVYERGSYIRNCNISPAEFVIGEIRQLIDDGANCSTKEVTEFFNGRLRAKMTYNRKQRTTSHTNCYFTYYEGVVK